MEDPNERLDWLLTEAGRIGSTTRTALQQMSQLPARHPLR